MSELCIEKRELQLIPEVQEMVHTISNDQNPVSQLAHSLVDTVQTVLSASIYALEEAACHSNAPQPFLSSLFRYESSGQKYIHEGKEHDELTFTQLDNGNYEIKRGISDITSYDPKTGTYTNGSEGKEVTYTEEVARFLQHSLRPALVDQFGAGVEVYISAQSIMVSDAPGHYHQGLPFSAFTDGAVKLVVDTYEGSPTLMATLVNEDKKGPITAETIETIIEVVESEHGH